MSWLTLDVEELRKRWMKLYLDLNLLLSTDPEVMKMLGGFKERLAEMNWEVMVFFDERAKPKEAEG